MHKVMKRFNALFHYFRRAWNPDIETKRRYRQFLTSEIIQTRNQSPGGHGRGPGGCNCDAGDTNIVVKTVTRVTPNPGPGSLHAR